MDHATEMRAPSWRTLAVIGLAVLLGACGSAPRSSHVAFPEVTTRDGALLAPLRLVTFVASNDNVGSQALFAFSAGVGASRWWRRIAPEYHLQALTDVLHVIGPPIVSDVTDHDVFTYITDANEAGGGPARDGHTLYLLYLPAGINVIRNGSPNEGCAKFGGYHVQYGTRGDNLAVIQQCSDAFPFENMTMIASHEIIEAATDPDGFGYVLPRIAGHAPWTESIWNAVDLRGYQELGDLCEGTFWVEGRNIYQRAWSNAAARRGGGDPCIPELGETFYDTSIPQDWYPVAAGGKITIPVTGWATGFIAAWGLSASVQSDGPGFSARLPDDPNQTLADRETVPLSIGASDTLTSGSFAVIRVSSRRPIPAPGGRQLTDASHQNYVGVYVP